MGDVHPRAEIPYEDFDWDPEAERLHQLRLALAMTPAQRLRWLESTIAELRPWVGLARADSSPMHEAGNSTPYEELPGGDLVRQGLEDLRAGVESAQALLVRMFAPRLRQLAFEIPDDDVADELPGHRLYALLQQSHGDAAHSRYNALVRRLVSFARAAECAS